MVTFTDYLESQYMEALNALPEESPKMTAELLEQYKEIVITTMLQQFGLRNLVDLKDGGNVTTLHNARNNVFANQEDERRFKNPYNKETRKNIYEKDFSK